MSKEFEEESRSVTNLPAEVVMERFREQRERLYKTRRQAAEASDGVVKERTLYAYEAGQRDVGLSQLIEIANSMNINLEEVFSTTDKYEIFSALSEMKGNIARAIQYMNLAFDKADSLLSPMGNKRIGA